MASAVPGPAPLIPQDSRIIKSLMERSNEFQNYEFSEFNPDFSERFGNADRPAIKRIGSVLVVIFPGASPLALWYY